MALKDRLKNKKSAPQPLEDLLENYNSIVEKDGIEFEISIKLLAKKILNEKDNAKLGAVVKELAKFLNSLSDAQTHLLLKGNFDIGKKALIECLLGYVSDSRGSHIEEDNEENREIPKLIKKRKAIKAQKEESIEE